MTLYVQAAGERLQHDIRIAQTSLMGPSAGLDARIRSARSRAEQVLESLDGLSTQEALEALHLAGQAIADRSTFSRTPRDAS